MLETVTENHKASKPGVLSPQSSILDFFASPSNAKSINKKASVKLCEEKENEVIYCDDDPGLCDGSVNSGLCDGGVNTKLCDGSDDDSVVLLSDGCMSRCGVRDVECPGSPSASACGADGQDGADGHDEAVGKGAGMKHGCVQQLPAVKASRSVSALDGATIGPVRSCHSGSKKKSKSSISSKKRKLETQKLEDNTGLVEAESEGRCHGTVVSYEAFMQSLTTGSPADIPVADSPRKENVNNASVNLAEGRSDYLPNKGTIDFGTENAVDDDGGCPGNSSNMPPGIEKTAQSLFGDGKEKASGTIEDEVVILSGDEKAKNSSILNFFQKLGSAEDKNRGSGTLTVSADVHRLVHGTLLADNRGVDNVNAAKTDSTPGLPSPKSPGVAEMDDAIELLESQTVISNSPRSRKINSRLKKISKRSKGDKQIPEMNISQGNALPNETQKNLSKSVEEVSRMTKSDKAHIGSRNSELKPIKERSKLRKRDAMESTSERILSEANQAVNSGDNVENSVSSFKVETFLKSSGSYTVPSRSAQQSTLGFSKTPTETTDCRSKAKDSKSRKKKVSRHKPRRGDDSFVSSPELPGVRYRVSSLQFDDARQTPIKMKLRLKKASSAEESDFTPTSKMNGQKLTKARKLLKKAKKAKNKLKSRKKLLKAQKNTASPVSKCASTRFVDLDASIVDLDASIVDLDASIVDLDASIVDLDASDGSQRRRSARLASHVSEAVVVSDDNQSDTESAHTPVKAKKIKQQPKKETPKKKKSSKVAADSPKKQKSKVGGRLAPIFKCAGNGGEPSKPEDPEKVKLRNAFLMRGIPDTLRRQAVATATAQVTGGHTGLSAVGHIQQSEDTGQGTSVWNLPTVHLPLRLETCFNADAKSQDFSYRRVVSHPKTNLFKDFRCHEELPFGVVETLLTEVEVAARGVDVRQTYTDTCRKLREDLVPAAASQDAPVEANKPAWEMCDSKQEQRKKKGKKHGKGTKTLADGIDGATGSAESRQTADSEVQVGELMWTERYQPSHSAEVVGHAGPIQKLKSWLLEWKHRTHKEAHKMRRQMRKQTHPAMATDEDNAWLGEDSDFTMDSDDSDDDDDSLCNTMLITGPRGIGKTCTVYALAMELGYKVIEVNATASRNGKRMLSRLQEATQSHQVSATKDAGATCLLGGLSASPLKLHSSQKSQKESKLPTAFTNLFRKAGGQNPVEVIDVEATKRSSNQDAPSSAKRKRKREKEDEKEKTSKKARSDKMKISAPPPPDHSSQSAGLELSSTTLILFDEAEIYFDDDRGYLQAIQHLMTRTKIPIVLTTTDANFGNHLQARFEILLFKQPPLLSIAAMLQTICLTESVRTSMAEILSLVRFHGGDIRRSLLWLQFWLGSGGGATKVKATERVISKSVPSTNAITCSQPASDQQGNDDGDLVMMKPASLRSRRIRDEDSSSCNGFAAVPLPSNTEGCLPLVHCLRLETVAGVSRPCRDGLETRLRSYLQGPREGDADPDHAHADTRGVEELCGNLRALGVSIVTRNLLHLLPLAKVAPQSTDTSPPAHAEKTVHQKRSRIRTDLYDDEASNDDEAAVDEADVERVTDTAETEKAESRLSYKCLTAFSDYYDTLCNVDVLQANTDTASSFYYSTDPSKVSERTAKTPDMAGAALTEQTCVELELLGARHVCRGVAAAVDAYRERRQELPTSAALVVSGGATAFSLQTAELRLPGAVKKTHDNVCDCLPLIVHCNKQRVHLDYLPTLRAMSRAERHRQVAKTKRRFHHYFDNIGMSLKESSLNVLCQTWT